MGLELVSERFRRRPHHFDLRRINRPQPCLRTQFHVVFGRFERVGRVVGVWVVAHHPHRHRVGRHMIVTGQHDLGLVGLALHRVVRPQDAVDHRQVRLDDRCQIHEEAHQPKRILVQEVAVHAAVVRRRHQPEQVLGRQRDPGGLVALDLGDRDHRVGVGDFRTHLDEAPNLPSSRHWHVHDLALVGVNQFHSVFIA